MDDYTQLSLLERLACCRLVSQPRSEAQKDMGDRIRLMRHISSQVDLIDVLTSRGITHVVFFVIQKRQLYYEFEITPEFLSIAEQGFLTYRAGEHLLRVLSAVHN